MNITGNAVLKPAYLHYLTANVLVWMNTFAPTVSSLCLWTTIQRILSVFPLFSTF